MNLLKILTKKYGGNYVEKNTTQVVSPIGKFTFQAGSENFQLDELNFSINPVDVDDPQNSKPGELVLHLDIANQSELNIFPKSVFQQFRDSFFGSSKERLERKLLFQGDEILIANLISNRSLLALLEKERIFIRIEKDKLNQIVLTSTSGIPNVEKLEKYLSILMCLEKKVTQLYMTTQIAS